MDDFLSAYAVRERFRELAALDQQLTRWRWFQRNEHCLQKRGWRVRMGDALIRMGYRLQNHGRVQATRISGKP